LPGEPEQRYRVLQTHYPENVILWLKEKMGLDPARRIHKQVRVPFVIGEGKRTFSKKFEKYVKSIIHYPNKKRGWCPYATKAGIELMQREKIDAIISSSPPETTHLAAKELKSRFNIPWVADFRDLWTQFHNYRYGPVRKWFEKRLEIKTLSEADALVAVSQLWVDKLKTLNPGKKAFAITNGFDPEEVVSSSLTKKFTITFTGHIYAGNLDPGLLFMAIRELIDEEMIDKEEIDVRFYGPRLRWLDDQIKEYMLNVIVHQEGIVTRKESFSKQRESQILLIMDWEDVNEQGWCPGKIFEYLAARRPILATGGGEGVIKDLINQTGAGTHAADKQSVKEVLLTFYKEFKSNGKVSYKGNEEEINKYNQIEMARKYSEVLKSVTT
jgi:glycosyltransferase involved in cell wall biosynthesis